MSLSVTLAIPCYNAGEYLQQALDSVYDQTVMPEEILAIDDGSTDSTAEVIRNNPAVGAIVHEKNLGIGSARNSAFANARGDIIVFLDADGVADPRFIEQLLVCYRDSNVAGVGGKGVEQVQKNWCDRWRKEVLFQHWGECSLADVPFLFGLCSSYRRSVLQESGGFNRFFKVSGEDMDVGFRLHAAGYTLAYSRDAVVYHQRSDDAKSLRKMAYRHCLYGFTAQRMNNNYLNKISTFRSFQLYLRHLFYDGMIKGSPGYAAASTRLHMIMAKAWLDAIGLHRDYLNNRINDQDTLAWEGHRGCRSDESS